MNVSWRHIAAGAVLASSLGAAAIGQAQTACCARPETPIAPPPVPPPSACCTRPSQPVIGVPGVQIAAPRIEIGPSVTRLAPSSSHTTLSSGVVVSSSSSIVMLGGGSSWSASEGVAPSTLTGLAVSGGVETRTILADEPVEETYCEDKPVEERLTRPVQAVCIDDRGAPHPASRVDAEPSVDPAFTGEVFRCMAGAAMQVTLGSIRDGKASFASGETFSCAKGEALVHTRGGKLSCAPQTPQRNCNERSLLRRHGPGVKLVEVRSTRMVCEPARRVRMTKVEKQVQVALPAAVGDLALDGGVGQSVW